MKLVGAPLLVPPSHQPVPWHFEGSLTQGLDEQPIDPVMERLRQDLTVSGRGLDACQHRQVRRVNMSVFPRFVTAIYPPTFPVFCT